MAGSRVSRDIVGVLGTRAAWTLMSMVTGVIIARRLGPENRGAFALAVQLFPSTVVTLVKLGITQSNVYLINRKREPIEQIASNCATLALVMGGAVCVVTWLLRGSLLSTFMRGVAPWALALALVRVPLLLLDDFLYGVLQAAGRFNVYNARLVLSEILRLVLVVGALLVFKMGLFAAVLIHTIVTVVNVGWLAVATRREIPFSLRIHPRVLRDQLNFGVKSYVQTLTSHLHLRADQYMLNDYRGLSDTGYYSIATRFTEMMLEIPQAVGLVLYPKLASVPTDEVHRLTAQACRRTLLLTAMFGALIVLFGPFLITLWYGKAFAPAAYPLFWLSIGALPFSIFVILTRAFTSQNRQQVNISAGIVALACNIGLNVVLIPKVGIVGAAMASAISYSLACALLMVLFLVDSRLSVVELFVAKSEDLRSLWQAAREVVVRGRRFMRLGPAGAGQ